MHMAFRISKKQLFAQIFIMHWQKKSANGFCIPKFFSTFYLSWPKQSNGNEWLKMSKNQHWYIAHGAAACILYVFLCAFHICTRWTWVNLLGFFLFFYFWYKEGERACVLKCCGQIEEDWSGGGGGGVREWWLSLIVECVYIVDYIVVHTIDWILTSKCFIFYHSSYEMHIRGYLKYLYDKQQAE